MKLLQINIAKNYNQKVNLKKFLGMKFRKKKLKNFIIPMINYKNQLITLNQLNKLNL